ncbi:MAG: hypothetical protein ACTSPD_19710 [Promethearchaeota archaeon]
MEYKAVTKALVVIGFIYFLLSLIEIIFAIIIVSTEVLIDGESMLLQSMMINSDISPIDILFLWTLLILTICIFLSLGLIMILLGVKKKTDGKVLAKQLVIVGMVILILGFIKFEYFILLANTELFIEFEGEALTFQSALYNSQIAPFYIAVMWIFFASATCSHLILGLVIAAGGLKWLLEYEQQESKEKSTNQK